MYTNYSCKQKKKLTFLIIYNYHLKMYLKVRG